MFPLQCFDILRLILKQLYKISNLLILFWDMQKAMEFQMQCFTLKFHGCHQDNIHSTMVLVMLDSFQACAKSDNHRKSSFWLDLSIQCTRKDFHPWNLNHYFKLHICVSFCASLYHKLQRFIISLAPESSCDVAARTSPRSGKFLVSMYLSNTSIWIIMSYHER